MKISSLLTRAVVLLLTSSVSLVSGSIALGEAAVTVDHAAADADGVFRFKNVTAPRQNAARNATFTLVEGEVDENGGTLDALHDGELPDEADQPDKSFFFAGGQDGGRFTVDLGKVIPVKEVDTYSWHPGTRAPQVYKLYGSEGSGAGFAARPHRPQDPAQGGWKLIASVDTRTTKIGAAGGQYGVSVADAAGLVGNYRYLLFDVSCTEKEDPFGNTFFSEINVIDRDAPAPAPGSNAAPAQASKKVTEYDEKGYHLTFTSDDPSFDPKEQERLVRAFFTVYPQMAAEFNQNASKSARISIEKKFRGVAATEDNRIHANPAWFHQHPEDIDVVTHEGMHVVQDYKQWDPAWLREGLADYARYKYGVNNPAAGWTMPDYDAKQSYQDAYRVTARFLVWLEKHVKPGVVVTMDRALRDGKYSPETWKQQTGKNVDELWQDYGKNPAL